MAKDKALRAGLAAAILFAWCTATSLASAAKPLTVYSIYYSADTTDKPTIEQFLGCLTESSTFGNTWANKWGVGPITMKGTYVLTTPPPNPLQMGTTLQSEVDHAIRAGAVPPPGANYDTTYLVHGPSTVVNRAGNGVVLCSPGSAACGQHADAYYNGIHYQVAIVPLNCPLCGGGLRTATWIGEHEIAEAAADQGTASFEVGDFCESGGNITQLACCGKNYTIQQLDTPGGPGNCMTINATGSQCTCGVAQTTCTSASMCCPGLACDAWVAKIGDPPAKVCCMNEKQACGDTNDCCGGLACKNGKCACQPQGAFCLRDVDCCGSGAFVCDPGLERCVPAPPDAGPPDATSAADASSFALDAGAPEAGLAPDGFDASGPADTGNGSNGGGSCACRTSRDRGTPAAPFAAILGLALLGARRRASRRSARAESDLVSGPTP